MEGISKCRERADISLSQGGRWNTPIRTYIKVISFTGSKPGTDEQTSQPCAPVAEIHAIEAKVGAAAS
ncbi:hypothetical protein SIAM614_28611 [Stappia aggregata IAM 12614]|uniref:Uncharacterized protein n=1 Tax=Roseibium aggregatum (strain ATCC 25650 / DSM 13394 / JCM 20685 / NBRC 16684 / NCIMB 2208 / IAM 12614 / B1) TaxID=384765 RepID=A0P4A5_ROSAI|nr:hypothetical protein SIAM614_28611 [Stappia aggregata IAM 12614] [Roseibium aggregatum IAM 12614]